MNPIIKEITSVQLKSDVPPFKVGDGVRVHTKVREGDKERIQIFSGIVIARKGSRDPRDLHRPPDQLRRGRRARVPDQFAEHRQDRDRARIRADARPAVLPSEPDRQGRCGHQGEGEAGSRGPRPPHLRRPPCRSRPPSCPKPPTRPGAWRSTRCTRPESATSGFRWAARRSARCSTGTRLSHNPADPRWLNRDRFVLSAGHGSMFLYAWLHMSGYDLPLEELTKFRSLHSKTPGHPEFRETPGVEATTGPARPGRRQRRRHGGRRPDGRRAVQHAGAPDLRLPRRLPGGRRLHAGGRGHGGRRFRRPPEARQPDPDLRLERRHAGRHGRQDPERKRRGPLQGDRVGCADGRRPRHGRVPQGLQQGQEGRRAASRSSSSPRRSSARASPRSQGTQKAHGEGGAKFADAARAGLGLPADQHFYVSEEVRAYFAGHKRTARPPLQDGRRSTGPGARPTRRRPRCSTPPRAPERRAPAREDPGLRPRREARRAPAPPAARSSSRIAPQCRCSSPAAPTCTARRYNYIRPTRISIRRTAPAATSASASASTRMAAICNGIAYDGHLPAVVRDVPGLRRLFPASIRLAALSKLPVVYIYTHDSIGVGEDGPTHQPVETDFRPAADPGLRCHPPGRPRGDRRRVRRRPRAHRRPDAARPVPPGRSEPERHSRLDPPGRRPQGRLRRPPGDRLR